MKSLFSRLRHNRDNAPSSSSRPVSQQSDHQEMVVPPNRREPCKSRPSNDSYGASTPNPALHSQSSSSSSDSTRPHSLVSPEGDSDLTYIYAGEETIRGRTNSQGEGVHVKKVTFRSPMPTPTASLVLDEIPSFASIEHDKNQSVLQVSKPLPASPTKAGFFSRPPSASSRSSSRQSLPTLQKPVTMRQSSLINMGTPVISPNKSTMSPTPSEMSLGGSSQQSYLLPPASWSEMAEDELIANLGPRERTRQEVLYEIVSSEERYVQELVKLNETFCRPLLPPSASSPSLNLFDPDNTLSRTLSPALSVQSFPTPNEQAEFLPIAAQYSSNTSPPTSSVARMQAYNALTNGRPGEQPSRTSNHVNLTGAGGSRSHHSLPPPKRDSGSNGSISARMSYHPGARQKGPDSRVTSFNSMSSIHTGDTPLPEALEKVLTVLAGGILEGHIKLAAALRKRYDNQYPLVRSLADIFTAHSYILREYATYVNHLESALEQVEHALTTYTSQTSKRASRRLNETDLGRLGKTLLSLEELAAERGESGLQISLSKPFQRLLKYPLLFQNLLFNTDPSLKEYEATLVMVDDVEEIVRSIEDEKASMEEREKTRDVWARIEGLDKDKALMAPKSNRLLVSESSMPVLEEDMKQWKEAASKQKKSFRRLSDILKGSGDVDIWVVRFTDVSLLCARTGMTHLPVSNTKTKRNDSLTEISGKSRSATTGRRGGSVKARNLYRFLKVHEWHLEQNNINADGLVSMDEIFEAQALSTAQNEPTQTDSSTPGTPKKPTKVPVAGDCGQSSVRPAARARTDTDTATMASDQQSVMSFAFQGVDHMRPVPQRRPLAPPGSAVSAGPASAKTNPAALHAQRRISAGHMTSNAANAKFAHRLRPHETEQNGGDPTIRASSRTRQSLPPTMAYSSRTGRSSPALAPTDRNSARPAWNSSLAETPKAKVASIAPSIRESVRGVRGIDMSVTGQGRRVVPKAMANLKAAEGKERTGVNVGNEGKDENVRATSVVRGVKPSPSIDPGVAGMWTAYRDGGATGTPRKVPAGRQLGGRI